MQILFALAAGVMVGLVGWRYAAFLRADTIRLGRWVEILERLRLILGERSSPLAEALRLAADGKSLPDTLLHRLADGLHSDPLLSLAEHFSILCDDCTEKDDLVRMFSHLSRGSLESRILSVEQAAQALRLRQQTAAEKSSRDAALWHKLGWIAGACLTLLLI